MSSFLRFFTSKISIISGMLILIVAISPVVPAGATAPVELGSANNYAVLAGQQITSRGSSVDGTAGKKVGVSHYVEPYAGYPSPQFAGATVVVNDAETLRAQADLDTAWATLSSLQSTPLAEMLGGKTLTPGVYQVTPGFMTILSGNLTLNGQGDSSSLFVIRSRQSLAVGGFSNVILTNGAQASNVFWLIDAGDVSIGYQAKFVGNLLFDQRLSANTVEFEGQILGRRNSSLTLADAIIRHNSAVYSYSLTFDSQSGSGSMAALSGTGVSVTLPLNSFTKAGSSFAGWNTSADGSGTAYADGAVVAVSVDVTRALYAQWTQTFQPIPQSSPAEEPRSGFTYSNTFEPNTGAGLMLDQVGFGFSGTLSTNLFTKANAAFVGWNSRADGTGEAFKPNAAFTRTTDSKNTYFAQWQLGVLAKPRIFFSPDSFKLSKKSMAVLDNIIASRRATLNRTIFVSGHSDSMPGSSHIRLSTLRAEAVATYLRLRLPKSSVLARGYGNSKNVSMPLDVAGQQVNRSVVVD